MEIHQVAAVILAAVLGADALVHAYWLTGRVWPARDVRALSHAVLGADVPFTPRVLVPLIVVLCAGALAVLRRADLITLPGPAWLWTAGAAAVAIGLLIRGVAGVVWLFRSARRTWFYRLNAAAYTPACLILSVAAAAGWRR